MKTTVNFTLIALLGLTALVQMLQTSRQSPASTDDTIVVRPDVRPTPSPAPSPYVPVIWDRPDGERDTADVVDDAFDNAPEWVWEDAANEYPQSAGPRWRTDFYRARSHALSLKRPCVVEVTTSGFVCPPCKALEAVLAQPDVVSILDGGYVTIKVDAATPEGLKIASDLGANSFPRLLVYDVVGGDTELRGYKDGFQPREVVLSLLGAPRGNSQTIPGCNCPTCGPNGCAPGCRCQFATQVQVPQYPQQNYYPQSFQQQVQMMQYGRGMQVGSSCSGGH